MEKKEVEIFFGTNRNKKTSQNPDIVHFGEEINQTEPLLNFGKATITLDENGKNPEIKNVSISEGNPVTDICCSQEIFDDIKDRMQRGIDTVLFFHGFYNTFENSLTRAAKLKHLYETKGQYQHTMIVFSWPSNGELLLSWPFTDFCSWPRNAHLIAYKSDRQDARESGEIFAEGLKEMSKFLKALCLIQPKQNQESQNINKRDTQAHRGRLNIMAHSMGVYALSHISQNLCEICKTPDGQIPKLLDEIVLIAADEDSDAFSSSNENKNTLQNSLPKCQNKLKSLPELAHRIAVYFNKEDLALKLSEMIMGNPDRLGSRGASDISQIPSNVFLINCENIVDGWWFALEHEYHKTELEVIRNISDVLKGSRSEDIFERVGSQTKNSYYLIKPKATYPLDSKPTIQIDPEPTIPN